MIRGMSGRSLLSLAVALLPVVALAAPKPPAPVGIVLRCEACTPEQRPSVGLLWRADAGQEPEAAGIETLDWAEGRFSLKTPDGTTRTLQGAPLGDGSGWSLQVPMPQGPSPFRVVAVLEGYASDRAAWWPEREAGPYTFAFEPVPAVLDRNPDWDPGKTGECDVLVPKTAPTPVAFFVQGQPRAWLYPAPAADDGTPRWTFQFVRPGEGLLERVNVLVPAFDEGGAWSFRLPLHSVLSGGATWPAGDGGVAPAASGEPVDEIRISGAGTIRLSDCPRATR